MTSVIAASSSASSSSARVISQTSIDLLKTRGIPVESKGGCRVVLNTLYMSESSTDSEISVYIPEYLESFETLTFFQLNEESALKVWNTYLAHQQNFPHRASILRSACRYVENVKSTVTAEGNEDWERMLSDLGMSGSFKERVMQLKWENMRLMCDLKETICDMFRARFEFLEDLDNVIKTPAKGVKRRASRLELGGNIRTKSGPPAIPPRTSSLTNQPDIAPEIAPHPESIEGHTMFLKGATLSRLESIHKADGSLDFARIASTPPGDFSASFRGVYLTKSHQVAWQYAQWAHTVVDGRVVPVGIFYVAIPNHLLASYKEIYGEEWQKFVWNCRQGGALPKELRYLRNFQWLVGPLCHQSNCKFAKMRDTSELEVWKLDRGETACQHFANTDTIIELLDDSCRGKVWIEAIEGGNEE